MFINLKYFTTVLLYSILLECYLNNNLPERVTANTQIPADTFVIITRPTFTCCGVITRVEISGSCSAGSTTGRLYLQTLNSEGGQYVVYDSSPLEQSCGEPNTRLRSFPVNLKFKSGHYLGFYVPSNDNFYQVALYNMGPGRPSEFIIIPSVMNSISVPPNINDSFNQSSFQNPSSDQGTHIPIIRLKGNQFVLHLCDRRFVHLSNLIAHSRNKLFL